ncbi:adenine phosphoribosyltransferase [Mesoterricola silvestris]|uniref:Adenine phosphoribosyltransferase n=1 Tax=Mesoterricola silvestris TaxID=2927979 RepID=A0AA48H5A3_9BACT|nr:adenine phosphoribosyltransferase [Mesoterricola silvestris]BDU72123.1 adenine phosphoribosyltransferase [Mesoterricola silvestris]
MTLKSLIRTIPHYPKEGVQFRDVTTLMKNPEGFRRAIDLLGERYRDQGIRIVAGIESRGFIVGAALAHHLGAGFVPIRKKGKLPAPVIHEDYELEYGLDRIEVHVDAIGKGERVLLVDDLIATGGTAEAALKLIGTLGGVVVETAFLVDLPDLGGRRRLEALGHKVFTLTEFEGD